MQTTSQGQQGYPSCLDSKLQQKIAGLESDSIGQDVTDKKAQLAGAKKLGGEVDPVEISYKQGYESLVFGYEQSRDYVEKRKTQIDEKVPGPEQQRIQQIVASEGDRIACLKQAWIDARKVLPAKEQAFAQATIDRADKEEPYKEYLNYKTDINDLDALHDQSTTQIEQQNYRAGYFLVEIEMNGLLTDASGQPKTPPKPDDFNTKLEQLALDYFDALDKERQAKTALDLGKADSQKKKKAYEDAEAKRRENILKLIADEPFAAAPASSTQATKPGAGNH